MMTVLGETQQVMAGDNPQTAEYSAAVERQYAYEAGQAAEFGTSTGVQLLDNAIAAATTFALGSATSFSFGGGGGISSGLESYQLSQVEPQVNFPPPGSDRIYVPGTEPTSNPRLPVPYEPPPQPGPFAFGIGGIGAILGGVIAGMWEGWPNALGDDEWLGRIPRQGEQGPPPETQVPLPEEIPQGPLPETIYGPPGVGDPNQIYNPTFPQPYGGEGGLSGPEDSVFGPSPEMGPPQGARQPTPAPAPTTSPGLPPWVWPLIGGLGAIQLGRAGRSRSSQTLPSVSVLPSPGGLTAADVAAIIEPLLSSQQLSTTNTYFQTQAGGQGVWDTSSSSCDCSPRKSGKKRKCLARAQLSWRSGPKKGRAAGSRCYRFAD